MNDLSIKNLIKDNFVVFDMFREDQFHYTVQDKHTGTDYSFPVPLSDIQRSDVNPTLLARDKAIYFMRYIRKAMEAGTLVKIGALAKWRQEKFRIS